MSRPQSDKSNEERDRRVLELWERVVEVEQRLIPTGLHVFGRAAGERECADLLRAVASFDRPECGARSLDDLVAEGLGLGVVRSDSSETSPTRAGVRARALTRPCAPPSSCSCAKATAAACDLLE